MNGWLWTLATIAGVFAVLLLVLAIWLWRSGVSRSQAAAFLRASGVDLVRLPGRLRRLAVDPRVPRRARWWLIGLAIYVASPIDPIPDFIPIIGLLDEAFLVPVVLIRVKRLIPPEVWAEYFPPRSTGSATGPYGRQRDPEPRSAPVNKEGLVPAEPTQVEKVTIDVSLVRRLVAAQFPDWADLPIRPVAFDGWDNRTFHLGEEMTVRLPSAAGYAAQVEKEQRWLPRLAPLLPLPIPVPLGLGRPAEGYPWPWSVYRWLDGEIATTGRIADLRQFATALAGFLTALQRIDASGGPPPGPHNVHRGGSLTVYDRETRDAIVALAGTIDTRAATDVWEAALAASWHGAPVWFHGDVATGNLLLRNGRLGAVIDFGTSGVGDPACDVVIAWNLFGGESREAFRAGLSLDPATWARGRGWALWKALIVSAGLPGPNPTEAANARRVIAAVLADHRHDAGHGR